MEVTRDIFEVSALAVDIAGSGELQMHAVRLLTVAIADVIGDALKKSDRRRKTM